MVPDQAKKTDVEAQRARKEVTSRLWTFGVATSPRHIFFAGLQEYLKNCAMLKGLVCVLKTVLLVHSAMIG